MCLHISKGVCFQIKSHQQAKRNFKNKERKEKFGYSILSSQKDFLMLRSPSTDYTDVASKLKKITAERKIESGWNPNGENRDNIALLISH